MSGPHINAGHI